MESPQGLKKLAKAHWKEHSPKLYQGLQESGELENSLDSAVSRTLEVQKQIQDRLVKENGYSPKQAELTAWEMVREEWLFTPEESAEPNP